MTERRACSVPPPPPRYRTNTPVDSSGYEPQPIVPASVSAGRDAARRDASGPPPSALRKPRSESVASRCAPVSANRGEAQMGLAACVALSCLAASSRGPTADAGSDPLAGASSSAVSPTSSSPPALAPARGPTSNAACCSRAICPDPLEDKIHVARFSDTSALDPSRDISQACAGSDRRKSPPPPSSSGRYVSPCVVPPVREDSSESRDTLGGADAPRPVVTGVDRAVSARRWSRST